MFSDLEVRSEMRKSFKIENLECANCAAKMENDINKLDGVNKATISFMSSKLLLDAEEARFNEVLKSACSICKKYESDCTILV